MRSTIWRARLMSPTASIVIDAPAVADGPGVASIVEAPAGGGHGEMPPPILADCTEPLAPDAPDLRGMWKAYKVEQAGKVLDDHPLTRHVERIEQCGDRVVITAGKIIHDMRADSTLE